MFINLLAFIPSIFSYIFPKIRYCYLLVTLIVPSFLTQALSINQTYEEALQAFHQEQFQDSIIHLKNILKRETSHLPSRVLMAENLLAQGKASAAEVELNFAVNAGADSFRVTPLLAKSYLLQTNYQKILDIHIPENSSINYQSIMQTYFGYAYLGQRQYHNAKGTFEQVLVLGPDNLDALLGLAKISMHEENIAQALITLEQALAIDDEHEQTLLMLAIVYKLQSNLTAALTTVNQLLLLNDKNYSARLTRAMLLFSLGENDKAKIDLDIIIKHFPNEPIANYVRLINNKSEPKGASSKKMELHLMAILAAISPEAKSEQPVFLFLTGLVNFQNNAMENAQKSLIKYHKIAPQDIAAITLLGRTEMALGDYYTAKKYLVKALLLDESDPEVWGLLARSYMMTNELEKAEFYFKKVLSHTPNDLTTIADLATLYLLNEKFDAVQELLAPATKISSSDTANTKEKQTQILIMLLKALQKTQQYESAMQYSKQLLLLAPQNSYAFQVHGSLLALQGDVPQAKIYFTQAIKLNKNNFQAVMYLARTEALLGNINASINLLESALKSGPNSALYIELGDVYQGINDRSTSMTWYQKALAHNPSSLLALNKIVSTHKNNNQLDEAITATEKYLESFGDNAQAYKLLAQLFQQKGWYKKALSQMNHFVRLSTDHADAHYQLAQLQIVINKSDQAILSLQKSISWQKDFMPSYLLLLSVYNKNKNEQAALRTIQNLSLVSKDSSLVARLKGDAYWSSGQNNKALSFYQQSYQMKSNRKALLGIFRIYRINKQFSQITKLLTPWVDAHENDYTVAISLAENHHQLGDLLKANAYYESLLKRSSANPVILNNAAIVNRELKQYDRAAELSEMAYQLMPQNVQVLDTKAWIEFHRGNTDKALALLRKANTLDYEDAEVKYHLAVTLSKLNRLKEAKKYLKESVRSQQDYPEKSQAKSLLATW